MPKWFLQSVDVSGGFLDGLLLQLPNGLTCIIGPRGSGKSTLAEALRYGLLGMGGVSPTAVELVKANMGNALLKIATLNEDLTGGYSISRTFKQDPVISTMSGRSVSGVDLDRGTFLPFDAYSNREIEDIADQSLGEKRRALLDDLRSDAIREINFTASTFRRELDANADSIRRVQQLVSDLKEQVEELGDARGKLASLPSPISDGASAMLERAARQVQMNSQEEAVLTSRDEQLGSLVERLTEVLSSFSGRLNMPTGLGSSENAVVLQQVQGALDEGKSEIEKYVQLACEEATYASERLQEIRKSLAERHAAQAAEHMRLVELNESASIVVRERINAEQSVKRLEALENQLHDASGELLGLLSQRQHIKAGYIHERERLSSVREEIAGNLQAEAGRAVRLRVVRNADDSMYRQLLGNGLRGSNLKNHEALIETLSSIRPEHLAQVLRDSDCAELEQLSGIGVERCQKVVDAFLDKLDPLQVEIIAIDDRVCIELNVGTDADPNFKDASELSRGQKCTALLPLLLARRDVPLVIDQPEDNLDNHFIYETVVETVRRVKHRRQMLFITHNANIPVLGEADLVVVMNSDGKRGYIEKSGTLDDCREEIVDLLEGGREAFELRRQRYDR